MCNSNIAKLGILLASKSEDRIKYEHLMSGSHRTRMRKERERENRGKEEEDERRKKRKSRRESYRLKRLPLTLSILSNEYISKLSPLRPVGDVARLIRANLDRAITYTNTYKPVAPVVSD